jgi:hypothetical protein
MNASLVYLLLNAIRPFYEWARQQKAPAIAWDGPRPGQSGLATGEIHGDFKSDTQIGKRGFFPHGSILLLYRESPVVQLVHG